MRLDRGEEEEATINLTPMIDMVFLLLIFFLASTTFAVEQVEMGLTLPEARNGKAGKDAHLLVINVTRDGALHVDGRVVTLEALHQKLKSAAQRNKDQEVLIRGDTSAQFGVVAKAFDACLGASLRKVSIAAQPDGEGQPR